MQAFLAKLNGQTHRFYLPDHGFVRRGSAPSVNDSIVVNGAAQTGSTLNVRDANLSVTNYFKPGDYIAFSNQLCMVTAACNSTGTGTIAVPVAPPIRKPTVDGAAIDYLFPVLGVFMLTSSASWDTQPGQISSFTIDAVEDVLA